MGWNHRDKLYACGVKTQAVAGVFEQPVQADLLGMASADNGNELQSAQDPTQNGSIWDSPRIFIGETGVGGGTIPLRGFGGTTPPALDAWALGRILKACGFSETRQAAAQAATTLGVGSTTTAMVLANSESSVDDFMIGTPLASTDIGTGFRSTTLIQDYVGSTRTARLAETLGGVPSAQYTIPAHLRYLLGTLTTAPPLLSISIWRDKLRYDYRDCAITSWSLDLPVANEANQSFPAITFAMKGIPIIPSADTAPILPASITNVPVAPNRAGKFFLDRVMLGHGGAKLNLGYETGAASNANQDAGQDGYDLLSGSRSLELDLNQYDVSTFDLFTRVQDQTIIPFLDTWSGGGTGNKMGLLIPSIALDPMKPGARNGYVNVTGNGNLIDVDKSVALSFWA